MGKRTGVLGALICGAVVFAGGCSTNTDTENGAEKADQTPVTLTLFADTNLRDEDFATFIQEPLQKSFPHVTIRKIDKDKETTIQNLIAAKETPDLIWLGLTNIQQLTELDIPIDLDPLVQANKFQLQRLDPQLLKSIRSYAAKEELLYLPFRSFAWGLHYNKSIFDKFGAEHPTNGMTWDDAIDLARKVTRNEDGVDYRGLSAGTILNRMQTQLSLPYVDAKTEQSVVSAHAGWKTLFQTFQAMYSIPGNYPKGATFGDGSRAFLETKTLAMFPHLLLLNNVDFVKSANEGFQWGIVRYPTFKDKPDVGPGIFSDGFAIPHGSKHPELAFQLVAALLSDEVQLMASKKGSMTALTKQTIKEALFEESPLSKQVDFRSLLTLQSAEPHVKSPYDEKARGIVTKQLEQFFTDKVDMNTAMRESDQAINKMVAEEKAKK